MLKSWASFNIRMSTSGPDKPSMAGNMGRVCCCTGRCWSWQMNKCWRKSWNYKWAKMEQRMFHEEKFLSLLQNARVKFKNFHWFHSLHLIRIAASCSISFAKTRWKLPIKLNESLIQFHDFTEREIIEFRASSEVKNKFEIKLSERCWKCKTTLDSLHLVFTIFSHESARRHRVSSDIRHFHSLDGNFYRALSDDAQWSESDSSCIICQNMAEFNKKSRNVRDKRLSNLFRDPHKNVNPQPDCDLKFVGIKRATFWCMQASLWKFHLNRCKFIDVSSSLN